jgi:hypothetical protein
MTHHKIPQRYKVTSVVHFFSEKIRQVSFTTDMLDIHKEIRYILPHTIFPHLDKSKSFGSTFFGPINACIIIVVDSMCGRREDISNTKKIQKLTQF